jgi:hypothetical protein
MPCRCMTKIATQQQVPESESKISLSGVATLPPITPPLSTRRFGQFLASGGEA